MTSHDGSFEGKAINIYPEENAIGFVFQDESWARKFYLETVLRGGGNFTLKGDEVIRYLPQKKEHDG